MNSQEKKKLDRERRGQISGGDLRDYIDLEIPELIEMLKADIPTERTIAASILGDRGDETIILPLCTALKSEEALYSRIAISEALSKIGEPTVPLLIDLLGEIGNNQETELPRKYFNKKSFPLARDMAARTLVKIGKPATPHLIAVLECAGAGDNGSEFKIQQAVDALGGIADKTGDKQALKPIIMYLGQYSNHGPDNENKITLWKLVRALSGFKGELEASKSLIPIIKGDYEPPIIWEAVRSLGQLGIIAPEVREVIEGLKATKHPEIRKAAEKAYKSIIT